MRISFIPRRFRHVPLLWWVGAALLAVVTGVVVAQSVARAQAAAAQYEGAVTVFVASRPMKPGHSIAEDDVHEESRPKAFLPYSAPLADPVDAIVTVAIDEGEPVTEAKVGSGNFSSAVALLQQGEQGVAIPLSPATPAVELGDPVDVLATFTTEGGSAPTTRVAVGSRVIGMNENAITVAVTEAQAAAVAFAAAKGVVSIVLTLPTEREGLAP